MAIERIIDEQSELEIHFKEPDTEEIEEFKITPEMLPSRKEIARLRSIFSKTSQCRVLKQYPLDSDFRTVQVIFSDWEYVPGFVEGILDPGTEEEFEPETQNDFTKASITGTTLHQVATLLELLRYQRLTPEMIMDCFPNFNEMQVAPYIQTILSGFGMPISEVLIYFLHNRDLISLVEKERIKQQKISKRKIPDPPHISEADLKDEIEVRESPELYEYSLALAINYLSRPVAKNWKLFSGVNITNSFETLSPYGEQTRVHTPYLGLDFFEMEMAKHETNFYFYDLKTGRMPNWDYTNAFQALLMHFHIGHFLSEKGNKKKGTFPRVEDFYFSSIKGMDLIPRYRNYQLCYRYLDKQTGITQDLKIEMDYESEAALRFFDLLALYSDVLTAYKAEWHDYIKEDFVQYQLPFEFPELSGGGIVLDLSRIPPSGRNPKKT